MSLQGATQVFIVKNVVMTLVHANFKLFPETCREAIIQSE